MSSIDDRIVNMEFNNRSFLSGVKDSLSSLDQLKKGLDLKETTKGIADLEKTGKNFSLQSLADGVETITNKLSTMGIIGITALTNIVNKAVDAGTRMVHALSVEPIMDGFREYELKMGSIQTILANTARYNTGLDEVTKSLDELNLYADKTIYNFGDMTRNIGLFTNAGLKLEEATSMIKGFSNEAAASGTNAQGAAGAAYQLSQALSAGTIRLMDWRSLTNVGMGNKNMQNGLIEIADAMGTLSANSIDAATVQKDFNGSLEKNWLSAEVMSNYLQIMAGDMDAAAMSALGLSDAQIEVFSKQQKTAEEAATKVRTWTQLFGTLQEAVGSSWAETFDLIIGDFDKATELFTNVNNALGPVIDAMGDARNKVLSAWVEAGGRDSAIRALANVFNALMAAIKPIREAFEEIFPPITGEQLATITKAVEDFTERLKMGEKTAENVKRTFRGFFAVLDIGWTIIQELGKVLGRVLGTIFEGAGGVTEFTGSIGDWLVSVRDAIKSGDGLSNTFKFIGDVLVGLISGLKDAGRFIGDVLASFKNFASAGIEGVWLGISKAGERFINSFAPFSAIADFVSAAWEKAVGVFQNVMEVMQPVFQFLGDAFKNIGNVIMDGVKNVDVDGAMGILGTGLLGGIAFTIKKIYDQIKDFLSDGGGVTGIVDSIKNVFGALTDTMEAMQNNIKAGTLLKIAGAIALLTVSVVALSLIDPAKLASSLTALTVMFGQLFGALVVFEKIAAGGMIARLPVLAIGIGILAIAIGILVGSVVALSQLDWVELAKGTSALAALFAVIAGASKLMSGPTSGMLVRTGIALTVLAVGVRIMAEAVESLSALQWDELARGMAAVAGVLTMFALFSKFAGTGLGLIGTGLGLVAVGLAMNILAGALKEFAKFSWEEIGKSMVVLAGSIGVLALGLSLMSGTIAGSLAMVVAAAALMLLVDPLEAFSQMGWEEIGKAMVVLAGSMIILAGGLYIMSGALPGAIGLTVAAAALNILMPVLERMGKLSWEEIGKGMTTLAGSLLIMAIGLTAMIVALPGAVALTVAAAALTIFVPVLQALGSMKWGEIWTGIGALALALGTLAIAGILLLPAIPGLLGLGAALLLIGAAVALAGVGIMFLATGLATLAVSGAAATAALVYMVTELSKLIPMVMEQIAQGIIAFAETITAAQETFLNLFVSLLTTLVEAFTTVTPQIVEALLSMLSQLLQSIENHVPAMVQSGMNILLGFLRGIRDNIQEVVTVSLQIIENFINGVAEGLPGIIDSGFNLIISFIEGLTNAIYENSERLGTAGGDLAVALIDGMVNGIWAGVSRVVEAAKGLANDALSAAKNLLGINSPSKEFHKIGNWTAEGMAEGMDKNSSKVEASSKAMGRTALDSIKDTMSRVSGEFDMNTDLTPTITPVLDLTNLKKGAGQIGSIMGQPQKIKMDGTYEMAKSVTLPAKVTANGDGSDTQMTASRIQNIELHQTNTSPKALSEIEIYRQTKNLLSTAKEVMDK